MSYSPLRRLGQTAMLLVVCLAVPACANKKINQANYDKITNGMTLKEVQDLFGESGKKEEGDAAAGVAAKGGVYLEGAQAPKSPGSTYVWDRGEITITVYFDQNGKVVSKTQKGW